MGEPQIRPATAREIEADWREFTGGPPVVGVLREYAALDVDGVVWSDALSGRKAVATWWVDRERAEIVSVHAEPPGGGAGTRVMDSAEEQLRQRGVKTVVLATTNDNARALNFYIRRGYRLIRLRLDAMDRVRERKPGVLAVGRDGVPLQDVWELEKRL